MNPYARPPPPPSNQHGGANPQYGNFQQGPQPFSRPPHQPGPNHRPNFQQSNPRHEHFSTQPQNFPQQGPNLSSGLPPRQNQSFRPNVQAHQGYVQNQPPGQGFMQPPQPQNQNFRLQQPPFNQGFRPPPLPPNQGPPNLSQPPPGPTGPQGSMNPPFPLPPPNQGFQQQPPRFSNNMGAQPQVFAPSASRNGHQSSVPPPGNLSKGPQAMMQGNVFASTGSSFANQGKQQDHMRGTSANAAYGPSGVMNTGAGGKDSRQALSEDQLWVNSWLKSVPPSHGSDKSDKLKVGEVRDHVQKFSRALSQLKELSREVEGCECRSLAHDHPLVHQVAEAKAELELLQQRMTPEWMGRAKAALQQRRNKRARVKRKRQARQEGRGREEARRAELHDKVDRWRLQLDQQLEKEKRARELQRCADASLSEVRHKMKEAEKALNTFTAVRTLRSLRLKQYNSQGLYTTRDCDEKFERELCRLEQLMTSQMETYRAENDALTNLLEEEAAETIRQDTQSQEVRHRKRSLKDVARATALLFGEHEEKSGGTEAEQSYRNFYRQADLTLHSLVSLRREWDACVVPENEDRGTHIPGHWVIPGPPASKNWAKLLVDSWQR